MRKPVDGIITQRFHTAHQALDIKGGYRSPVYAPHSGTITHAGQLGSGTNDAGLAIDINGGKYVSRLGHNDQILVYPGQQVKEGQHIAYEGFTGYTQPDNVPEGSHVHWVLWENGVRVNPEPFITTNKGVSTVFENDQQIQDMYYLIRGKYATAEEVAGWRGKPIIQFAQNQYAKQEVANRESYKTSLETQLAQVRKALAAEQAKPPKEVVKEVEKIVEKIVEKPVEVIKEVEVVKEVEPSWLVSVREFINKFLKRG